MTTLVTGGTGTTGRRVAAALAALSEPTRIATRTPRAPGQVRFSWADGSTFAPALSGVDSVYLLAPAGSAEPAELTERFLDVARAEGVRRVVLLSSSAVPDSPSGIGALPALVRRMPEWAVLRPSWFMQNFTGDHPVAVGIRERGEVLTATGDGRVAFVDAGDIAAVAARALTDAAPHNTDHIITGPEALSYAEAVAIVSRHTGRPARHRAVTTEDLVALLESSGMSTPYARMLAALDEHIREGGEDRTTSVVAEVTGRPARSFERFASTDLVPALSG
ncbi:NmrA family NAD(P)-binding protein [Actinokineospora bangkokensis]|uniref:Ergot alkaloid biosynthesis protein n=1 Tax=Actinokineospora bangkokensis TaxID=1193682 RepID=A0A1Q9LK11_9PSEU|nr:NmrA family NAD(P)-binding protein [Actinokineospora bangkokensis]OLR92368.1 ergot alkaloid biosynthesis protein [Actinokineospora bangkokensis]